MQIKFITLVLIGCLYGVASATCSRGCASCTDSTCSRCHDKFYWDTLQRDCIASCAGSIDKECRTYGGLGICYHNETEASLCKAKDSSGTIAIIIICSIVGVSAFLFSLSICLANRKKRKNFYLRRNLNAKLHPGLKQYALYSVRVIQELPQDVMNVKNKPQEPDSIIQIRETAVTRTQQETSSVHEKYAVKEGEIEIDYQKEKANSQSTEPRDTEESHVEFN